MAKCGCKGSGKCGGKGKMSMKGMTEGAKREKTKLMRANLAKKGK